MKCSTCGKETDTLYGAEDNNGEWTGTCQKCLEKELKKYGLDILIDESKIQ